MTKLREPVSSPLTSDIATLVRSQLSGRRGLLTLAAMTGFAGIALNWSWLVAAGIAPILIAVLPCLVMCGLGLCMNKMRGGTCESEKSATSTPQPDFTDVESPLGSPPTESMRRRNEQRLTNPPVTLKKDG